MSAGNPWWFSGEDSVSDLPEAVADESAAEASAAGDSATQGSGEEAKPGGSGDWTALLFGAQRMVDWATEKVMAPHAEHVDPRQHPQCVVCRTMVLLGEVPTSPGDAAPDADLGTASPADGPPATRPTSIEWITIRGEGGEP